MGAFLVSGFAALTLCYYAFPGAKPARAFAEIALATLFDRQIVALCRAGIDLTWTANAL